MERKFQNKSGFLPTFSPNARTARRSAGPFRPSRPYPCSLHSKCGSVLSPPATALSLPVRQPPPNRTDAASGALRVFSGTHSARSRRRPEWKQRGNSAASPGAGRAPDRNRQDSGTPEYERYLPLRSAAIPEKKPQRTPGASVRRTISQRTDCNQLYLWENICDLFIIILFEQPYSFEIRYNRTNLLLFSHYRNQSRYLQILVC